MNDYQQDLYSKLINLTTVNEAFYFQDFTLDQRTYRIFNYRLASYTDFLQPGAMECRGVMFEVDSDGNPIRLAALPMSKFFNLNENPMTMDLDLTNVVSAQVKADGSLMSTFVHDGKIRLKSKGSTASEQCLHAMEWLYSAEQRDLFECLSDFEMLGYTVNLEWCAPQHRIVLGYMQPQLIVLNARHRSTGEYVLYKTLKRTFDQYTVSEIHPADPIAFLNEIKDATGIEGYVVTMADGMRFKVKCDWYLSLHHAKDSVTNPRRLFECILDEAVDDLRSMFATDPLSMQQIDEMQVKVDHLYNAMVKQVEQFYEENKHLDRKDYAVKGQQVFAGTFYFSRAMNLYLGKPPEYKAFLKGKYKELGFRDTSVDPE